MISKDDREIFAEATRDVRPIKGDERVARQLARPRAAARKRRTEESEVLHESLHGALAEPLEETGFRRPGLADQTFRRLQRGEFAVEDEIDLHGLTRAEARSALREFLTAASAGRLGCVRVIHGKGSRSGPQGPVLKQLVHQWLTQWNEVLAFATARARHGGTGAVYVLLR